MKEKTRVRNVLVFDLEQFQEDLVKELIVNNISYVQVENEFHFLDKIYRFYDLNYVEDLGTLIMDFDSVCPGISYADGVVSSSAGSYLNEENKKVSYTKKMIKEDIRRANARFKGSVNTKVNNFGR